ncbi:MAG: hypothetical protein ABJZ55_12650 [Fuerstiella sp.]
MALPPHKLDDVFQNVENPEEAFLADSDVKEAFEKAKAKYKESKEFQEANPGLMSASPEQAARVVFMQSLNDSDRR